jgi:hypothetical protein
VPSVFGWSARSTRWPRPTMYYDQPHIRGVGHRAALRQLGNRLVGILHGRLETGTKYDEATAWGHRQQDLQTAARQHILAGCLCDQGLVDKLLVQVFGVGAWPIKVRRALVVALIGALGQDRKVMDRSVSSRLVGLRGCRC